MLFPQRDQGSEIFNERKALFFHAPVDGIDAVPRIEGIVDALLAVQELGAFEEEGDSLGGQDDR